MKKYSILLCMLLGLCIQLFSLELVGTRWGPERGGHGFYLDFTTERDFVLFYGGSGGGQNVIGTYVQNNNNITLTIVTINEWGELPAYIRQRTIHCEIIDANSIFSLYKLVGSGGLELWSRAHIPENETRRILDGNVVYVLRVNGKITENARIREGPGLQYRFYSFNFYEEPRIFHSLPRGWDLRILAYTEQKTIVGEEEASWYFVVFQKNMWEDQFGWVWGGLLEF